MKAANLDPEDPQVRAAVFGEKVQEFLRGEIGTFLIRRAEAQLEDAVEALKHLDARVPETIIRVQERIKLLENFEGWLGDAVQEGLTAIAIIDGEEGHAEE